LACTPEPLHWYEEIRALLDRGLIDAVEAIRIEAAYTMLADDPNVCASFEDTESLRGLKLDGRALLSSAAGFDMAITWHTWRGRPELVEQYRLRAAIVRSVARDLAEGKTA
jgi:hypothetical protein